MSSRRSRSKTPKGAAADAEPLSPAPSKPAGRKKQTQSKEEAIAGEAVATVDHKEIHFEFGY